MDNNYASPIRPDDRSATAEGRPAVAPPLADAEAEPDRSARLEAERLTPTNDELRSLIGKHQSPPGLYGPDEELPY